MAPIEPYAGGSVTVHPAVLRTWAVRAHDVAKDLELLSALTNAAGDDVSLGPCSLRSVSATVTLCRAWAARLEELHLTLDGYSGKLRTAAVSYETNDFTALDVFRRAAAISSTRAER